VLRVIKKPNMTKRKKQILANNLPLLANEIISDIVVRTQKGLDVKNKGFNEYSAKYKKIKKGKPNLTVSSNMLNSITWRKLNGRKQGITIYFSSGRERAKAAGNNKKREFFGIDPKQRKYINKQLAKLIFK